MFVAAGGNGDMGGMLIVIGIAAIGAFLLWIYKKGVSQGDTNATQRLHEQILKVQHREQMIAQARDDAIRIAKKKIKAEEERYLNDREKKAEVLIQSQMKKLHDETVARATAEINRREASVHDTFLRKDGELHLKKQSIERKEKLYVDAKSAFNDNVIKGRNWLADFIIDAEASIDKSLEFHLRTKRNPALSAAEQVKKANQEKREALNKLKLLEYQLKSYKEYFPFLEEYEELILEDEFDIDSKTGRIDEENVDKARLYLDKDEYEKLSHSEKYQLALERYIKKNKSNWEIGRCYERYIGYLYEIDGWDVSYFGAIKRFEDMGRDLLCRKNNDIQVIQAKCWSRGKVIHEKHIFQLYGTTLLYEIEQKKSCRPKPVFVSTTGLSDVAMVAAERLGVEIKEKALSMDYPMIKCNISMRNDEKIYHLPFDQQYDKIKIDRPGECYAKTVKEAEEMGFRRAKKYIVS